MNVAERSIALCIAQSAPTPQAQEQQESVAAAPALSVSQAAAAAAAAGSGTAQHASLAAAPTNDSAEAHTAAHALLGLHFNALAMQRESMRRQAEAAESARLGKRQRPASAPVDASGDMASAPGQPRSRVEKRRGSDSEVQAQQHRVSQSCALNCKRDAFDRSPAARYCFC